MFQTKNNFEKCFGKPSDFKLDEGMLHDVCKPLILEKSASESTSAVTRKESDELQTKKFTHFNIALLACQEGEKRETTVDPDVIKRSI